MIVKLLATCILILHLVWVLLVIFGAFWTRRRPFWTALHLLALVWGIVVEVGPWPCPLTFAEQYLEGRAGLQPSHGSYLLNCLDSLVYPNLPYWIVAVCGVAVCAANLGVYAWRGWIWLRQRRR
jgi:hypothetical protein